jgi:hypothetical protein
MDSDGARKTTITNAKLIPQDKFNVATGADILFDRAERPRGYGLAAFLYENEAETAGEKPDIGAPPMTTVLDNGRVVAIGPMHVWLLPERPRRSAIGMQGCGGTAG